jgi:ABC transporter ATM
MFCMLQYLTPCVFPNESQIIVLENGLVVDQGPHDVLLSKAGRYAQLWGQQNNTIDALDATIKTGTQC